jgi:hypothetical protein
MGAAKNMGDSRLHAKATVFFALEELRANANTATKAAEQALHRASEFHDSDFGLLRARLEDVIRQRSLS